MSKGLKSIDKKIKSAFAFDFKPDAPEINLPEEPPEADREGEFAAEAERKRRRRMQGRASTILTSGASSAANVAKSRLG